LAQLKKAEPFETVLSGDRAAIAKLTRKDSNYRSRKNGTAPTKSWLVVSIGGH